MKLVRADYSDKSARPNRAAENDAEGSPDGLITNAVDRRSHPSPRAAPEARFNDPSASIDAQNYQVAKRATACAGRFRFSFGPGGTIEM